MKIIVAGGAGFLGSHLCQRLLDENHQVICIDNLVTGNEDNLKPFKNQQNFKFLKLDISEDLPKDLTADRVYHLASPASPNRHSSKSYHSLPFETMRANTTGTWNLAELARKNQARLLFASTSESYGDPLVHPQAEEYRGNVSTTGPRSVYDESKRFGETIVAAYVRSKGLDGRIIRIFNTYGPGMSLDDGRVVIEFMKAAINNQPLPVFGDGLQTRSFCFVSDLIEGIIKVMETPNLGGEVVNLGNPHEFTILELAQKIKEVTGSSSEILFKEPLPQDDPLKRRPDIEKAKKLLDWEPKVDLLEGLKILLSDLQNSSQR